MLSCNVANYLIKRKSERHIIIQNITSVGAKYVNYMNTYK